MTSPRRDRRSEILDAALRCFVERGIAATTIADIRERAGATTGSVYHVFPSKDAIVGALYVDRLRSYQSDLLARASRHRTARAFIRGITLHYLEWVEAEPDAARFLFDARRTEAIAAVAAEIAEANRESFAAMRRSIDHFAAKGDLQDLPMDIFIAVVIGPAAAYARHWLEKESRTEMHRARALLADLAWASVQTKNERNEENEP
ncbi:TetR/AcrR family transcriptional regulator [Pendulispora albinea]|uniref:TetR/AcrR family transcriptional regulator n=1 Tax=Pendulispora albinea TaxID=2741071 RepID=A0ABZ2LM03_9BACT